jgi:hypothetical protein
MRAAFACTRRRFFAFVGGASALLLVRCAEGPRPNRGGEAPDDNYSGPFFSDGSGFTE